jgi:hypothetical protein
MAVLSVYVLGNQRTMSVPPARPLEARPLASLFRRVGESVLGSREAEAKPFGPRSVLGYAALLVAGTVLAFCRIPSAGLRTLWAEDASVFATGAYAHPWWRVVLEPYAGYAAVYPRTLAAFAVSVFNLTHLPVAFAVLACATTAAVGVIAVWALRDHISSLALRGSIFALIVAMPVAGVEVNGSIANSHWYLMIAAFLVLGTRQRTWTGTAVGTVVIAISILSDPLTLLALPLALLRLTDRGPRRWVVPASFALAASVQLAVVAGTNVAAASSRPSFVEIIRTLVYRTMLQPLLGSVGAQYAHSLWGSWAVLVGGLCVIGILGLGLRTPAAGFALVAAAGSVTIFAVASIVRWTPSLDPATGSYVGASRYSVVPIALMCMAIVAILARSLSSFRRPASAVLVSVGVLIAIANLASIGLGWNVTARAPAIAWQAEVANAEAQCEVYPSKVVKIAGDPRGFDLSLACTSLKEANGRR